MRLAKWAASAAALTLATAGAVVAMAADGNAASTDVYAVAPYVDMSNSQEGLLDTAITGHGLKSYTAAFVLGSGCNQIWGDTLPVGNDSFTDPLIAKAKAEGASLIISSGGAAGLPLAWTCSNQSAIEAGYQALINDYGVTQLDFDIEGAAVADTAAATRQMQAMKDLKASNPNLKFSVTLPVLASGLTNDGVNIVKAAKTVGVKIDVVNIMTMDFYSGTGTEMGQGSVSAAQATMGQMQAVDSSYGYGNLGITPMIGKNDDGSTFTLADAQTVVNFASQHGVGRLAFWAVTRDQQCGGGANSLSTCSQISQSQLAFTDAFLAYAGGSGGTSGGTTGGTTTGGTTTGGTTTGGTTTGGTTNGGTTGGTSCTTASWSSSAVYVGGNTVSWKGHNWKAKWWTQGEEPGTTGEWGVWQDLGAC
ncbi:chitinase [Actinacidiphila alni]|uniref:chitinase n=1 Tax=Actinacidiphila alni TaxID=380248 RepID=UPI0033E0AFEA